MTGKHERPMPSPIDGYEPSRASHNHYVGTGSMWCPRCFPYTYGAVAKHKASRQEPAVFPRSGGSW